MRAQVFLLCALAALGVSGHSEGERPLFSTLLGSLPVSDLLNSDWARIFTTNNKAERDRTSSKDRRPREYGRPMEETKCPSGQVAGPLGCVDQPEVTTVPARVGCPSGCHASSISLLTCDCIEEAGLVEECESGYQREARQTKWVAATARSGGGKSSRQLTGKSGAANPEAMSAEAHRVSSDICVKPKYMTLNFMCPVPGSHLQGEVCVREQVDEARPMCPQGWHLEGDLCIKQERMSARQLCPEGFEISDHGLPRASEGALIDSLSAQDELFDETLESRRRLAARSARATNSEAHFHHLHTGHPQKTQRCVSTRVSDPVPRCPDDFRLVSSGYGHMCQKDVFELPLTDCPHGFQPDFSFPGMCRKESTTTPINECPNGFSLDFPHVNHHSRRRDAAAPIRMLKKAPVATFPQPEQPVNSIESLAQSLTSFDDALGSISHATGIDSDLPLVAVDKQAERQPFRLWKDAPSEMSDAPVDAARQCEREIREPPRPQCREGFEFSIIENACIKILREEPRLVCANPGFVFDGKHCVLLEREPSHLVCPRGQVLKGSACVSTEIVSGSPMCPKHRKYDYQPGLGRCVTADETPARLECAMGMELHNSKCVDTMAVDSTLGCPREYRLDATQEICIKEITESPVLGCADSRALPRGSVCTLDVRTPAEAVCPGGFQKGIHKNQEMCLSEDVRELKRICPFGFVMYMDRCVRQFTVGGSWTCPAGAISDPSDDTICLVEVKHGHHKL